VVTLTLGVGQVDDAGAVYGAAYLALARCTAPVGPLAKRKMGTAGTG
jgi:hypothetical protein